MVDNLSRTMIKVLNGGSEDSNQKHRALLMPLFSGSQNSYPLTKEKLVCGRAADADIQLNDEKASRYHANRLSVHNFYYIQDLNSTNGTYLNGARITSMRLAHGDNIKLGDTESRFVISEEEVTATPSELSLETVTTLALAVEAKDLYTKGHSERGARVAIELAKKLAIDTKTIERLRIGALLHDVGKIGVPESILLKTGKLTDEEFSIIKKHPAAGETILKPIGFLADILPTVRHHHERYDGRGYPDGLAGENFPLLARIVQVADTFDAMTSNRPYRDCLAEETVIKEFKKCSGSQFDPAIVEAFLEIIHNLPGGSLKT